METPVLTSKQLRKSLSAKKGIIKGLKNVLANPFENNRPVLKNDCAGLEDLLKSLLPASKRPELQKIPWSKLRMMSKEERSLAKKNTSITSSSMSDKNVKDSLVFGTNSVIRLLEKDNVCSILLDTTIANLPVVVPDIIQMTKSKNVPIFLIPFLKKVTLETVGFASGAICLKRNVAESSEHYFYPLYKKISELQEETESKIAINLFKDQSLMNDTKEDDEMSFENVQEDSKEVEKPFVLSTDIYLYRKSKSERVFKCSNEIEENQPLMESSDFIPLGDIDFDLTDQQKVPLGISDKRNLKLIKNRSNNGKELKRKNNIVSSAFSSDNKESQNSEEHYKPLKVKRLQGNPLRTKRTKPKGKK